METILTPSCTNDVIVNEQRASDATGGRSQKKQTKKKGNEKEKEEGGYAEEVQVLDVGGHERIDISGDEDGVADAEAGLCEHLIMSMTTTTTT